jgi:antitoxin component YwqK of YwqJK toxin-antitoxin module
VYDESNYALVRTETDDGIVYRKDYVYKYDPAREMKIEYWDNGRIMSKWFLYQKRLDGKSIKYDMQGKILAIDSFQNGTKVYSKDFFVPDTSVKIFRVFL